MSADSVVIRYFDGQQDYAACWQAMKNFTDTRRPDTLDEIWALEHSPIFTQGQNGKPEHILQAGDIPILQTDRGGQVTYHGPGQLTIYTLIDIKRKKLNVREFVTHLEQSVIQLLAAKKITALTKCKAPGVYVEEQKICSLGLRIRRGCSYHGLALNVDMDLSPFSRINPCGFNNLQMTQLSDLLPTPTLSQVRNQLIEYLAGNFGYTKRQIILE
jgi:lipoyl(octanoyl) transferase